MIQKLSFKQALATLVVFVLYLYAVATTQAFSEEKASWFHEFKATNDGVFKVTLDSNAPQASLNEFQNWLLTVTDGLTGEVVSPARIMVTGGMPMHGHGLPTQPQVTEYLGEGKYSVEGLKFNMHGQWVIEFQINTAQAVDTVVFEVIVDY